MGKIVYLKDEALLKKVAGKIKKLRSERNVTLQEFFNDTNIHLSRIEHSKANVTISTLNEVCKYFGLTLADFFKDIEKY